MAKHATATARIAEDEEPESTSARAMWSGTITFGLVSIPVDLYPANRPGRPGLRLLGPSGVPVRRRYAASDSGRELSSEHLVRGYEVDTGEHVVVTDAELEALAPQKSRDIELSRFVPVDEIDPMLFERGYFLAPSSGSAKAYRLLADVLERTGRAGIATFVMRGKEYLVAILAEGGVLRAETLRFPDEVRSAADVSLPKKRKLPAAKVKAFERAIAARAKESLDPDELVDPWSEGLVRLAEKKLRQHKDVVEVPEEAGEGELAEVIDLMEVLKRSLASSGGRGGAKGASTRQAPQRRRTSTSASRDRRSSSAHARARSAPRRRSG